MTMQQGPVPMLGPAPWPQTNLWAYTINGRINPTIHVDKGQPLEIVHANRLPATHPQHGYESWTSVHLHGSASLPQYDGYASDVIKPGQAKRYVYPNQQGARTLWYHDHGIHRTAQNAYAGLAAQYHLHDDMEAASGIPTGAYDNPLILRDALFATERDTALGRQRPVEPHGRRHPRQRRAVAGDAGAEAALPLPHPQRVRSRARSTSRSATRARSCG